MSIKLAPNAVSLPWYATLLNSTAHVLSGSTQEVKAVQGEVDAIRANAIGGFHKELKSIRKGAKGKKLGTAVSVAVVAVAIGMDFLSTAQTDES